VATERRPTCVADDDTLGRSPNFQFVSFSPFPFSLCYLLTYLISYLLHAAQSFLKV